MDRLHHPLEHWVKEFSCLFGIPVSEQLHRTLEVGEENGDLLALALQGGLGGEDLLGEMLRVYASGAAKRDGAEAATGSPHSVQNLALAGSSP